MAKRRLTSVEILTESQERVNSAMESFARKSAAKLPKFRADVERFAEAVKRAAR